MNKRLKKKMDNKERICLKLKEDCDIYCNLRCNYKECNFLDNYKVRWINHRSIKFSKD